MSAPNVLVTSAAGKTGRPAALALLERGLPVRALVRRDDARAADLRNRGAEVIVGNLNDIRDVRAALHGVQRAYWAAPMSSGALEAATMFASAAEDEHLEVVVSISQWLADPAHPSAHTRAEWLSDRVFAWMPTVASITVDPGFFAENYLYTLDAVIQFGLLTLPFGDGLNAPPSNEDIAAVAAALLAEPAPHLGRSFRPTGPDLVSPADVAAAMGRVLGRPVRYRDVPFALMAKSARAIGFNDYTVIQLKWYVDELKRGTFAVGGPTDVVQALTGRPPESMDTIARRYIAARPRARRSPAGITSTAVQLTRSALTRAPDKRRYLREHQDGAAFGRLAADSPEWHTTHQRTKSVPEPGTPLMPAGSEAT